MSPLLLIIGSAVFLAVFLGIFAINLAVTDFFKQDKSEMQRMMETELRNQMRQHARAAAGNPEELERLMDDAAHRPWSIAESFKKLQQFIDQAGMQSSPQKVIAISFGVGISISAVLFLLGQSPVLILIVFAISGVFPFFYINSKRTQRLELLSEQLPEALDLMARVLRSGQTITQAMNGVADEFEDPIGMEFGYCYEQQNLGLSLDNAMNNMVNRTGLIEIKILVLGINIQRQAGGNLVELLTKLSNVMRQRQSLRSTVKTLTAEGRMQAWFLAALPFCGWIGMYFLNRNYAMELLEHPELIYTTLVVMFLGIMWIRKIINFDF